MDDISNRLHFKWLTLHIFLWVEMYLVYANPASSMELVGGHKNMHPRDASTLSLRGCAHTHIFIAKNINVLFLLVLVRLLLSLAGYPTKNIGLMFCCASVATIMLINETQQQRKKRTTINSECISLLLAGYNMRSHRIACYTDSDSINIHCTQWAKKNARMCVCVCVCVWLYSNIYSLSMWFMLLQSSAYNMVICVCGVCVCWQRAIQ